MAPMLSTASAGTRCSAAPATLYGGLSSELHGGADIDILISGSDAGHADKLFGDGGTDQLTGGAGADTLDGGAGADVVTAGSGNQYLDGGDDNDLVVGGTGADSLHGGNGADAVYSGSASGGANCMFGDAGNDSLYAGAGDDTLDGGSGNDLVLGGALSSTLHGGADDDIIYSGSTSGHGSNLYGDAGNDTLYGGIGADTIFGGSGHDLLVAGHGLGITQTLIGGDDGSSFLNYKGGPSVSMVGGAGQDYFYLNNIFTEDTIDGGGGNQDSVTFGFHKSTDVLSVTPGSTANSFDVTFGYLTYSHLAPTQLPVTHVTQMTHVSNIEYLIFNDGNYTTL